MPEKIMLIDGNSIINRAFYAVPFLSNKNGEYTNAVYGFLNIFFKLYDEEKPDYIAVAFDLPKPTFRHEKFSDYKGTRKGMPDELASQLPVLKDVLKSMDIKIFESEGFEADDVIGTLADKSSSKGLDTVVISGDRDLLQLSDSNIKIRIPKTKAGKTEVEDYFPDDVLEKYGVSPKEFIDVKALMGDSSDNVPGVPGIGEKTAVKIIQEYKTVEAAIENAENVKPKKASQNLKDFSEQALMSKYLVTIVKDVPLDFDSITDAHNNIYNENSFELFQKLEFKSFINRFNYKADITENPKFKVIDNLSEAKDYFFNLNPWCESAYNIIEENGRILGISFSNEDSFGTFIAVENDISENKLFNISKEFFEGGNPKIAHDAKKDIHILNKHGVKLNNLSFDTMIAGYVLNSTKDNYDYNDIAEDFLGESYNSEEELFGKGKSKKGYYDLGRQQFVDFACLKSYIPFKAKKIMADKIEQNEQHYLYYDIELPLIYVLADMEIKGIKIDNDGLIKYGEELENKLTELTKEIYWMAGEEFNINSPKQLSVILFEKLGLKGGKKTKTGWSTSADVLEKLRDKDEIVERILDYRTYAKLKSTYADGLLNVMDKETHKIYSTFNQAVTATGRISSTEPNLQNIPIKIELGHRMRKIFIPHDDSFVFLDGDYSQIELRVLAHMAEDETLINAFNEGQDIHRLTASQVFNVPFNDVSSLQRSRAKTVNFGIIYGKQAFSLSQDLGIPIKEAESYIEGYFEKYPNVRKFMDNVIDEAKKTGYTKTIFNRIRTIPEITSQNFVKRSAAERAAMNMPIQGTAADIIKIAMIKVYNRLKKEKLSSRIILQVHDELLVETHKDEIDIVKNILKNEMENAVKLSVPLDVDVHEGGNWYEAK